MESHTLTCQIDSVAPVEHLIVMWFKNGTSLHNQTFASTNIGPSNIESVIEITPSRGDNGATYRCEAHLDLGLEGQRPSASKEYAIEVHCEYTAYICTFCFMLHQFWRHSFSFVSFLVKMDQT